MGRWKNKPKKMTSETEERVCLRCDNPFRSLWRGNRICPKCEENGRSDPSPPRVYRSKFTQPINKKALG
jgi:hypothetical protein